MSTAEVAPATVGNRPPELGAAGFAAAVRVIAPDDLVAPEPLLRDARLNESDPGPIGARKHVGANVGRALSDGLCAVLAFLVAGAVQFGGGSIPHAFLFVALLAPVVWMAVFWKFHLYRRDPMSPWEEYRRVLSATTVATATIVLASFWLDTRRLRATFVIAWLTALTLELVVRPVWRARLSRLRREHALSYRTLILGTNDEADHLAHVLAAPGSGFLPLGYVASSAPRGNANGLHVLDEMEDLVASIRANRADCVFVASSGVSPTDLARLAVVARQEKVDVRVTAKLPHVLPDRLRVESVGDVAALSITPIRLRPGQACVKRVFDLVASVALLVPTVPIMLLVALSVKLTSRGPVLFKQERVTKGGRLFRIYKFRTMYHRPPTEGVPSIDATRLYFKMQDDPRLTRVGRILRRYSLDELPQLWNVIRGEISLVGPRPLWSAQVDLTSEAFRARNQVRAGITGWWQVNGRSGVDAEEALRLDLFYVENWSLTLDLYILLKTIPTVLRSNAF